MGKRVVKHAVADYILALFAKCDENHPVKKFKETHEEVDFIRLVVHVHGVKS